MEYISLIVAVSAWAGIATAVAAFEALLLMAAFISEKELEERIKDLESELQDYLPKISAHPYYQGTTNAAHQNHKNSKAR